MKAHSQGQAFMPSRLKIRPAISLPSIVVAMPQPLAIVICLSWRKPF
jgi:hypothetical protein